MNKKIYNKKCSGTTLIELMVVVTILSLVIIGLVSFFGGSTRSWISGQNQLQAQREARMALDRMVKEIRMANNVLNNGIANIEVSYPAALGKENVTFHLDANGIIMENNSPLINHIPDDGFVIKYLDSKWKEVEPGVNASQISAIEITLKVDVDNDGNPDIILETDVSLRNYEIK